MCRGRLFDCRAGVEVSITVNDVHLFGCFHFAYSACSMVRNGRAK